MGAVALIDTGGQGLRIGVTSRGLLRMRFLPVLLGLEAASFVHARKGGEADLYIGWGRRRSGLRALDLAERAGGAPVLLLEDGFLRSVRPGADPALSMAVDDAGIYYDAAAPSRLERLVAECAGDATLSARAAEFAARLRVDRISKYNDHDDAAGAEILTRIRDDARLVIDQTAGDASIAGAGADAGRFRAMLEAAFDEAEGGQVVVKCHPETVAGAKVGHIAGLARRWGALIVDGKVNPWDLIERAHTVYTVSSQLGFEALMAARPVRCFAMPFYAGWGLTRDEGRCERRSGAAPSRASLAAAAYFAYCRYLDPFGPSPTTPEAAAGLLTLWRDQARADRDLGVFVRCSPWKRRAMTGMFHGASRIGYRTSVRAGLRSAARSGRALVCWGAHADEALERSARARRVPLYRVEDGFLRSVGLGADFTEPLSLVLDRRGIYYDASRESDLEALLNGTQFTPELIARARALIRRIVDNRLTKYSPAGPAPGRLGLPADRRAILVPGQVDSDASIRHGAPDGPGMEAMLDAVRRANPDAFIVFKPHPDVVAGHRRGLCDERRVLAHADAMAAGVPIVDLIEACDEVHTLTSLTGFEALMRGKPVTCFGLPFYAGWGLTRDRVVCLRRTRRLCLEELVAGALILYPRYLDPVTGLACPPEIVLSRLTERRRAVAEGAGDRLLVRLRRVHGRLRLRAGGTGW